MNKISQYLNEHILGEVIATDSMLEKFSRDGSVLQIKPELVAFPRSTNDIRKIARFSWQLAEKGHTMPITVRGGGTNQTGSAIGSGVIVDTSFYLNKILYVSDNSKDLFIHAQPGLDTKSLNDALKLHELALPSRPTSWTSSTIGGLIADNFGGELSGSAGMVGDAVRRLEVVLANGDLIETTRINKRDLNKKKGLQTLEGEIYRKIDGLIEDNRSLIDDEIAQKSDSNIGYGGISKVKQKDGSFDLTPLFVASQGTLGIISEAVLDVNLVSDKESVVAISFNNLDIAIKSANQIMGLKPDVLELFDDNLLKRAQQFGRHFIVEEDGEIPNSILYVAFTDFSENARKHKIKKILKILSRLDSKINVFTNNDYSDDDLQTIFNVEAIAFQPTTKEESLPSLIDGSAIPLDRVSDFIGELRKIADKYHIQLPYRINWLNGIVYVRPNLKLHTVGDKQKVFKIINDYTKLIADYEGTLLAECAEGRLKASVSCSQLSDSVNELYSQIRQVFDPYGTLNPGVKQKNDLTTLATSLNSKYNMADISPCSIH